MPLWLYRGTAGEPGGDMPWLMPGMWPKPIAGLGDPGTEKGPEKEWCEAMELWDKARARWCTPTGGISRSSTEDGGVG